MGNLKIDKKKCQLRRRPQETQPRVKRFSRTCALFATRFPLTQLAQPSVVSVDPTSRPVRVSPTPQPCPPRLPGSGPPPTSIDGSQSHLHSLQVMPWLSPVFPPPRTELI